MACKKITKTNESESILIKDLENIFGNEYKAEGAYAYFESDSFINEFGDYVEGYNNADKSFYGRVDDNGEPKLFYDETAKKHYFLDKNKEKIFYPLINRGLRSIFNYKQIDKITSRLALNYFNKSKLNFLNFNTLTFEERGSLPNLKQFIKGEIESKIQELRAKGGRFILQALVLEKSLKNLDEYVENVDLFFKENSIKRVNILNEEGLQTEEDEVKDPSFTKSSFEQDSKNSISTNVKLKLSLLEDTNDLDPVWGEPTFKPFSEVYSDLINNITNQVALEGEDLFELQKEQIQRLTIKKPYLKQLLSFFDNKQFTEEDKNQFTQAFNLHGNNFLVSEVRFVTKKKEGKALTQITSHDVMEVSKSGSKASIVSSEWGNNFKNKFLGEDNKLKEGSKEYIEQVKNDLEALKELVKPNTSRKEFEDNVNNFLNISRKLGIELTKEGLMNYLDGEGAFFFDTEKQIDTLSKSVTQSIIALKKALKDFSKTSVDFKNPFDKEGVFKKMAKAESFFMSEGSDASIWSSGKNKWLFSYPSYLSTRIKQWQKNPELLRNWKNASAYNKGSALMNYLLAEDLDPNMVNEDIDSIIKERLEGLKLGIFNTFQDNDGNYSDSSDLSFKDYFNDYVNKTLSQSYSRTTTPADKGTDYQIKTGFFIDSFNSLDNNGETVFTQQTLDTFFNYFNSEFNRMKEAHKEVDSLKNNPESLFVNYHYKEGSKIDAKNGNAFLSQYFPELSYNSISKNQLVNRIKDELYVKKSGVYANEIKHTTDLVANKELTSLVKQYLKESLRQGVESTIDNFLSEGIFDVNEQGEIDNFGISRKVFDKYMEENLLNKDQALIAMASDFYINGLVSNIEYSKMFTGDVAFYKNMVDYKKRVPATYTDGLQLRLKSGEEFFNAATTSKVEIKPQEYAKIEEILGKEGAKPYANTNSADGQAWITPARWKFLMERLGKWSPLHSSVYEKMISDNPKPYSKEELKVVGQSLKGVYFYMNGKTPTFLKYSQAVLTKNLVKGTGLQRVYDQMNAQEVDELITLDGIKVGSNMPTTIHNEDGTVKDEFTFNVNQLSNYGWKLQQDLPTKTIKQTAVGSQIQKNIFAGLIFNKELSGFDLDGKDTNGQTIINNIVNIVDGLVEKGLAEVRDEFKVFRNGEIKNVKGFYNALVRELEERGGSKNVIDALKKETTLYGVPQSMDKIMSIFSSIMNDRLIKIKTNGGAFIQMSNFGINKDEAVQQGIIMHPSLKTGETAYEPHYYKDENGKKKVRPGGVFISGSFIAKYIPDYKKYSAEELFIGKDGNPPIIDEKIRKNLIGYRIPNQGLSSNDALEIIGILPEENGDTIVAYTGITTKTGSDFDIDKMYLMMANYNLEEGRLVYTEYDKMLSNKRQTKEALQNRLIELYKSVLTHTKVLEDVMKPLDNDVLKDNITNLMPTDSSEVMFHFNSYNDAKLRYEYTGGKAGVGQEANALVDINRLGELSINKYFIGWGAKNQKGDTKLDNEYSEELSKEDLDYYVNELIKPGSDKAQVDAFREAIKKIKISDSLTAILNAFVDIAKDPYITRGNWVTSTTNTGNLLIRAGVHPLYTTSFMAQPIIKEYIDYQSSLESILGNNSGDMKAKFKRNLVINDLKKNSDQFDDLKKSLPFIYQKLVRSEKSGFGYLTGQQSKEKLSKIVGKEIENDRLEEILTFLKDSHSKIFEEKKINITDSKYNLKYYRDQIKLEQDGAFQVALLDKFFELQDVSKALRENVDVSKVDTNGMGKNINSLYSIFNLKQHILDKESTDKERVLVGLASKFDKTPLGTYLDALKEVMRIVQANPSLFPQGQQDVQSLFNEISNDLYSMPAVDEKLMTELEKSYYTYVMSNFPAFNLSSVETRQLLDKLPERFSEFKKQNKDKYLILDELQIKNQGKLKLIALNNRKKSPDFEQKITDSWRDLIIDNPELGEDLIRYSFITSGFRMNSNQFYTYMPHEFLVKEGIDHFVKNFSKEDHSDFIDKFYLNNTSDYKFVNRVFDNDAVSENFDTGFILKEPGKSKYYLKRELESKNFNELGEEVTKKEKKYLTYKLEGYNSRNQAVYTRVQPLGNKSKGANIVEYGDVFTRNTLIVDETYIDKLRNTIVTSRNQFNPNFVLDRIEDRAEDLANDVTIEQLREEERIEIASKIPSIENYKVDGKVDKTLMPSRVLKKYEEIYDRYDKLITPLLEKETTIESESGIKVISEPYGVVFTETNPSKDATRKFVSIIQPQIQKQAYKENVGKDANDMFMYGLRWTRKSKAKSPLNNKSYANKGLPITDAKASDNYVYDTVDQNGNPLAPLSDLQPIISEIENSLGIDMSDYDAVIGNIYLPGQNISTHRDTTESLSARNYPVVVYTIGNNSGISVYENEKKPGSASFASDKKTTINTKNGSIYTFGMEGKGRFEVAHDTPKGISRDINFPPITMPNGDVITNYTITLTFRRVADLEENTPNSPAKLNKVEENAQPSTAQIESVSEPITSMSEITNHSGGAKLSDAKWDQIGREFGVVNHKHYREPGTKTVDSLELQKAGVTATELSEEEYNEGQPKATIAARQMGRIQETHQVRSNYIIRNWAQVKNSEAVYAIGTIIEKGTEIDHGKTALVDQIKGGTGYAVQMAINENKPVYVFDGTKDSWFVWNGEKFEKTNTPTLTKNFAGIGSRTLSTQDVIDKSLQAIRDVYQKTKDSISGEIKTEESSKTEESTVLNNTEFNPGQYVKYNGETYIVTQENTNGTIQIYNPNLVGASSKISVSKDKLTALNSKAKIVEHLGVNYIVTPSNTIISMTSNRAMKYLENDGNKKAILEKAGNNITKAPEVKIEATNYLTETKPQPQSQTSFKPANKQQEDAIIAIQDFIKNGNPKEIFVLEGKAGTGKTTIMQEAIANAVKDNKRMVIGALSHVAKEVLAEKVSDRYVGIPTKISSHSIAGMLGLRHDAETDEFVRSFDEEDEGATPPINEADIIIIDEASMVSENVLKTVMESKRMGAKVIFLGDRGQLPPIRGVGAYIEMVKQRKPENYKVILNYLYEIEASRDSKDQKSQRLKEVTDYLKYNDILSPVFDSPNKASLTERVRQGEESPILPFSDIYWDNSEKEKADINPVKSEDMVDVLSDKGNLVFAESFNSIVDDLIPSYKEAVETKNPKLINIVTYRNAPKKVYNDKIREKLFGENAKQIENGDLLMFQDKYTLSKDVKFENGESYSVLNSTEIEKYGFKAIAVDVKYDVYINEKKINTTQTFYVLAKEDAPAFNKKVAEMYDEAKKAAPYEKKNMFKRANAFSKSFAKVDYSYAITSHKSQGSTYRTSVVDAQDINSVSMISAKSKSKSIYTGITRASNSVVMIMKGATTNNDNVQKALSSKIKTNLTQEQQDKADELKKYCNPS